MEQLLKFKEEHLISEVTYQTLKKLIERKEDEKSWKKYSQRYGAFMLFIVYPAILFLLYHLSISYTQGIRVTHVMQYLTNELVWIILVLVYMTHHVWFWINKQLEEYEDDCDELRKEVIDRAEELWDEKTSWENRSQVYEYLDKQYDINLYHTS